MNQKNLDYLKENLMYMGFSDRLYPELQKNIEQGFPDFVLKQKTEYGKVSMESTLHFRKSDETDMYFFNRHDAHLQHPGDSLKDRMQTFYLNKGSGITLKESFNLLEGRAVNTDLSSKEGQKYNAWVQLNFGEKDENGNYKIKQFHQNYGYDLGATIAKYPIKELMDETRKERLIMSLQKGNLQSVTMEAGGKEEKMFISANPQFKTINVVDANMKAVQKETLLKANGREQELSQNGKKYESQKQGAKQDKKPGDEEEGPGQAPKKKQRTRQSIS